MENVVNKKIFLMCGAPGSGKSFWIETHRSFFSGSLGVISRDKIRFSLLKEGDDYFSKEKEVYKLFVKSIIKSLKTNDNTIIDATHLDEYSRSKILLSLADALDAVEINAIFINTPLDICLRQNNQRTGRAKVPDNVVINMFNKLTLPKDYEGFDNVFVFDNRNKTYDIIKYERW